MPRVIQSTEYFVVGGPVQPDRSCYVERNADDALIASIADQQFTYVLSPRASGKSSLMAWAIRRLRGERQLAAVVDLTQIGARGDQEDAGRWYYSIAYRILRELRLKVDLQTWWQDKSALFSEQRLVEFFWEIILANTTEHVTIFFDEIERAVDLPFAEELFIALRTCYARRVSEPDFTRLNFVVLGVARPSDLCPDPGLSPFVDGREIVLEDFTLEQCFHLTPGLAADEEDGRRIIERVFHWTHGQPYLTQKLARAVARKGGRLADVDRVVQEQFVAPGVSQEEPLLSHIRGSLMQPGMRAARGLLARLAKDVAVRPERGSAAIERARLAGVVCVGDDGLVCYCNRIYEAVFDRHWLGTVTPIDWRRPLTVAAVLAMVVLVPIWYTQVLPRPYMSTLSVVTQDIAVAEDAHRKLHRLPGFRATADRLLAEAMLRRSRQAQALGEVLAADAVLRRLPEREGLADEALADYWLRRAEQAMSEERRDEALVLAMQAVTGRPERAQALAGELISPDYPHLVATHRLSGPPVDWAMDWTLGRMVVVDATHRVEERAFGTDGHAGASAGFLSSERLTALQHLPVARAIDVAEGGTAGAFDLTLDLAHARAGDLQLTLTAPDGSEVTFVPTPSDLETTPWRLTASTGTGLAPLASAPRQGRWQLAIVDRRPEENGVLSSWQLRFAAGGEVWEDAPEQGVALPDPVRTDEVDVELSADGSVALAYSARAGALGALAVWDLASGRLRADLQLAARPEMVIFDADPARAIVVTDDVLTLWDVENGSPTARLTAETEFVLPPATSPKGDYVVVAEQTAFAAPRYRLLRVADGHLEAGVAGDGDVRGWVLGPEASFLALLADNGQVRFVDPRSGRALGALRHHREIERIVAAPSGNRLITIDAGGDIHAWPLTFDADDAVAGVGTNLGTTLDASSVDIVGGRIAFASRDGHAVVRTLDGRQGAGVFRLDAGTGAPRARLAPDGQRLLTVNGGSARLWEVPSGPPIEPGSDRVSALAVDDDGRVVALGFRGGHVRIRNADQFDETATPSYSVDFIGHRGPVSSLAVNAARNLIASGGEDGVVRAWDLVSVSPSEYFLRHPLGPVRAVTISPDGRWIASAAEYSARIWQVRDGTLLGEIPVNGAATALAFSDGGEWLAVGDIAGNVFFGAPRGSNPWRSVRMPATVAAAAFEPHSRWLAVGDEQGRVQLWDTQSLQPMGGASRFEHPIGWLAFSADGLFLIARSGHWVHRLRVDETGLAVVQSRFVTPGLDSDAVLTAGDASAVRLVGGHSVGRPAVLDVELAGGSSAPAAVDPAEFQRDWPAVLGLQLDMRTGLVRNSP